MPRAEDIVMRKQSMIIYQLDLNILLCKFVANCKKQCITACLQAEQHNLCQQAEAVLKPHVPVQASWDAHRH